MFRRVEIESDDILHVLCELRVIADFEGARSDAASGHGRAKSAERNVTLTPTAEAIVRVLQRVAAGGLSSVS